MEHVRSRRERQKERDKKRKSEREITDSKKASLVPTVTLLLTLSARGDVLFKGTDGVKAHQKVVLYTCNPVWES